MAPLHGNPPPEVRQNPPAGPRENCRRCHACGHRIGAGGFGLPPLLFCRVGLRGIFPARPEPSPFAKPKTVRPLSGRLVRNGPILQCYKFVTFLFPGVGDGPRLWRRNVQIFFAQVKNIRSNPAKKVQETAKTRVVMGFPLLRIQWPTFA